MSADRLVRGTYLHGIFGSDAFRQSFLTRLGTTPDPLDHEHMVEETLDALAAHLEAHMDVSRLLGLAGSV